MYVQRSNVLHMLPEHHVFVEWYDLKQGGLCCLNSVYLHEFFISKVPMCRGFPALSVSTYSCTWSPSMLTRMTRSRPDDSFDEVLSALDRHDAARKDRQCALGQESTGLAPPKRRGARGVTTNPGVYISRTEYCLHSSRPT